MGEGKHAPGPWEVVVTVGKTLEIAEANGDIIADIVGLSGEGNHDANASLIAAAPELYEALRKLANEAAGFLALSDIERHGQTNSRILRDRIEQARDLIAKATGEKAKAGE